MFVVTFESIQILIWTHRCRYAANRAAIYEHNPPYWQMATTTTSTIVEQYLGRTPDTTNVAGTMKELPALCEDVLFIIFSNALLKPYLPYLRQVCKLWREIIMRRLDARRGIRIREVIIDRASLFTALKLKCPMNSITFSATIPFCDSTALDWLVKNGCKVGKSASEAAARCAHFANTHWLLKNRHPISPKVSYIAVKNGHYDYFKLLYTKSIVCKAEGAYNAAIENGDVEGIIELQSFTVSPPPSTIIVKAVDIGKLEILLHILRCSQPHRSFIQMVKLATERAAENGNLTILRYFIKNIIDDIIYGGEILFKVAINGHSWVLKQLLDDGAKWIPPVEHSREWTLMLNEDALEVLIESGEIKSQCITEHQIITLIQVQSHIGEDSYSMLLKTTKNYPQRTIKYWAVLYSKIQSFPKNIELVAILAGRLDCLQWLAEREAPKWTTAYDVAAANKHQDIIEWLHSQGRPWDHFTTYNAAKYDNPVALRYFLDNGCPWVPTAHTFMHSLSSEVEDVLDMRGLVFQW